jgi:hypothetical protein
VLLETARQVQGDDVDVQTLASLLQGPVVGGARGDEVIVLLQLGNAEVGRVVGQEDVASSQYAQTLWNGKRQWIWYRRALVGLVLAVCFEAPR